MGDASEEGAFERAHDVLSETNLLIQRHQDIFSLDWHQFSENYRRGYLGLYTLVEATRFDTDNNRFAFLILKDEIAIGGEGMDGLNCRGPATVDCINSNLALNDWPNFNESLPMFVGIGDLVHCPQGVVPSGVWFLGFDESPLCGREFLFYSLLNPPIWEWIRLPCRSIEAAEGVCYARRSATIELHEVNDDLVQGIPEMTNGLRYFPRQVLGRQLVEATNYVRKISFAFSPEGNGLVVNKPVDSGFEVVKLALSSFDLFV